MALDLFHQLLNLIILLALLRMIQVGIASKHPDNPFGNALSFILG